MIPRIPVFSLLRLVGVAALTAASAVHAQLELSTRGFSTLYPAGLPSSPGNTPPILTPQYAGENANTGGSGAVAVSAVVAEKYPAAIYLSAGTGAPTGVVLALSRSTFGGAFAAGVPRYLLGDQITPPATQVDGITVAEAGYWRPIPVGVGETFTQTATSTTETPIPLTLHAITVANGGSGYTSAPTVTLSGGGGDGATAVATITQGVVTGIALTNAGTGYTSLPAVSIGGGGGSGATATATATPVTYYFSPHAGRVLASQAGRVSITWVTRVPVATAEDATLKFRFRQEAFSVSSTTSRPVRTIYWTERSFNGPAVSIGGKIEAVNPVYSTNFPAVVTQEYQSVGISQGSSAASSPPPELRTLWFQKVAGIGQIRAYNREGRILMEYLGPLQAGTSDRHEFLGADVVDIVRVAPTVVARVNLGDQITPRDELDRRQPLDGNSEYLASPVALTTPGAPTYFSQVSRADGQQLYYAERENTVADNVTFYWLEKTDAAIHFLPAPTAPNLGIYWPKLKNAYQQVWPTGLGAYAHFTVPATGTTAATSLPFPAGQTPQVVFQDDPRQAEAAVELTSQRLQVSVPGDGLNRTLLKFTNGTDVWYVRLYTQAEGRAGFQESDGLAPVNATVAVGDRIRAPDGYEPGGYVASGGNYYPAAYRDPFAVGAEAAATGAIIPVNAVPGAEVLKVWWFKRIAPPSAAFQPFYVPAKIGTYTAAFPDAAQPIVLASNAGSGDLSADELAGQIYYQNDRTLPGYNPNEEHAVLLAGRAYALRDDLNVTTGGTTQFTSQPFVLIGFTSSVDSRPAMRVFKVLREVPGDVDGVRFDYRVTAGTKLPAPMPLPLLPLPLDAAGRVLNAEVPGNADPAPAGAAAPEAYAKFTFNDRNGYTWVMRGPHVPAPEGTLKSISVANNDAFFTSTPTVTISGGGGTGGVAVATLTPGSAVSAITVTTKGDYSFVPTVTLVGGGGTGATAVAELAREPGARGFFVSRIRITNPGYGYTSAPTVHFSGGERWIWFNYYTGESTWGETARATATITPGGRIATVSLTAPGSGYTSAPTVTLSGGGGSGATATVLLSNASLGMQYYYPMREGFYFPGRTTQPTVGTPLPYLRPLVGGVPQGDPVTGTPLTVTFRAVWPEDAPELRVAETLTQPKFGLPGVLTQTSARVLYQQSIARLGSGKASVVLHDPIREKTHALVSTGGLSRIPASIRTTVHQGKTYFQGLPPDLQSRFYFDPTRGTLGALVFKGVFVDEAAGEDYVRLNVLSAADKAALEALPAATDSDRGGWIGAVNALATKVETFSENPEKAGTYKVTATTNFGANELPVIDHADSAVTNYALTATGAADGWVSLVTGNGKAFTPASEPVSVHVFRVAPRLNTGELKVIPSANPLDEKVTLRHSGDFAARADDYEFEWRYAPPAGGVAPATYAYVLSSRLGAQWQLVQSPAGARPTAAEYATALTATLPRTVTIKAAGFPDGSSSPGLVIRSAADLDFSAGVPAQVYFSADVGDLTGFVLYVNGVAALAYNAPAPFVNTNATSGLITTGDGLSRQFAVNSNVFKESANVIEVALFSSGDIGASTGIDFRLHASSETDLVVAGGSPWQTPSGTLPNQVTVGGGPTAPLGNPVLVMSDNYFTLRYRPKAATASVAGTAWSRWMPPKLVEGWIKRVLAGINPFNQRVRDLYNNAVNTDVSLLTQAGARWEGNVALSLDNLNDAGLIEIYETVLNRAKDLTIDAGYDYGPANDALLLAAGYLSDLYTILGNEAYADAANPTISLDDSTTVTEVNTARFSFEGQVASVLEEELALLRGRDDFLAPGVTVAPAYNRLFWNYTRGINSGEALYAVNYNIREKAGSPTANGVLDAADAQRMFPQSHGDAYGHFLTALKGYQRLLRNPHFTWTPRSEAVTVLGQVVQVDYFDERKLAAAAAGVARTAQQILALTVRQSYRDDPAGGWSHLRDGRTNPTTGTTRHWGVDEWAARATQGAYYNWVVSNAVLLAKDTHPSHSGVQVIDRTTVPELKELAAVAADFQARMDGVNAHLNPLGLSPGAIAFDISSAELKAGKSHYEQIHDRALRATLNAKGAFDQAARMTRLLRNQENQLAGANTAIVDQETAYTHRLKEIYGTPYPGEIGAGKTYAQGYTGPDLLEWFIIDRPVATAATAGVATPSGLVDTTKPLTLTVKVPTDVVASAALNVDNVTAAYGKLVSRTVTVQPNRFVQYSDQWQNGGAMGVRAVTGTLQQALAAADQALAALRAGSDALQNKYAVFERRRALYNEMVTTHGKSVELEKKGFAEISGLNVTRNALDSSGRAAEALSAATYRTSEALSEFLPRINGTSNDLTSVLRGAVVANATAIQIALTATSLGLKAGAIALEAQRNQRQHEMQVALEAIGFSYQQAQAGYEYEQMLRDLTGAAYEVAQLAVTLQTANERVRNLVAEGERLQSERETYRQRAAAVVQGYRTKDITFRTFRNEALEQYRSLFDLAGRYTYLAAKSYDYETGLLGSTAGQAVVAGIVAARSLGDLTGGVPQATVSTLGDSGLAGTMARLQADWSVAKGRLGINNPDQNGTLFSIRRELFRLVGEAAGDTAWQQTLEQRIMSNVMADADVAAACRNLAKPDGSAVPGIVIPFSSTIQKGVNFFGLASAPGDHNFSVSNYATKIYAVGMVLRGYVGMDPYSAGTPNAGAPNTTATHALNATPYVYLIPTGVDYLLAPPLGDTATVRGFAVRDQALPLPFNLGATAFSGTQSFNADGTLSEQPWVLRTHQAFRPVSDPAFFYGTVPAEFTSARLVGRSVWNGGWKIVIPAFSLLANEQEGLSRFVASVKDIELFLRTYSHAGN